MLRASLSMCCVAGRKRDHKHPRRAFDIDKMQADLDTANGASLCGDHFFPRDLKVRN